MNILKTVTPDRLPFLIARAESAARVAEKYRREGNVRALPFYPHEGTRWAIRVAQARAELDAFDVWLASSHLNDREAVAASLEL